MVNNVKTGYVNPLTMMKNSRQTKKLNLGIVKSEEKQQKALEAKKQSIQNSLLLMKGTSGNGDVSEESIELLEKKLEDITNEIRMNTQRIAAVPGEEEQLDGKANHVLQGRFDRYEKTVDLTEMTRAQAGSGIKNSEIDDFEKDRMMADYSRLQGGYLSDAVFGMLDLEGVRNVYEECIANGMTEEEASAKYHEKLTERLGHFKEALALALEFVPLDEDATGELISYSDVYDEDGRLKVPVKLTFEEYHRNLQSILENMMNALKDRKDDFPNLYKIYFHEQ